MDVFEGIGAWACVEAAGQDMNGRGNDEGTTNEPRRYCERSAKAPEREGVREY